MKFIAIFLYEAHHLAVIDSMITFRPSCPGPGRQAPLLKTKTVNV